MHRNKNFYGGLFFEKGLPFFFYFAAVIVLCRFTKL